MKLHEKRIVSLFLLIVLILGIFPTPIQEGVFAADEFIKRLTIVHVNDVHGRIKEGDYDGMGYSKMATKLNMLRQENPNLILLDAGDTIHGLPIVTVSRGESMIKLMNQMGFDAMVPGNHDFNYGYDRLVQLKDIAEFPILGSNIINEKGEKEFKDYIIKELDGIKVGIFGIATPETKYKANPKNTEDITFLDPIDSAKDMVKELKDKKVDLIIALTHIGIADDANPNTIDIANNVDGIDIIVDGHSHTLLPEGKIVKDTLIVQAGEYVKNLGIVNIELHNGEIINKEAVLFTKEEAEELEEDVEIKRFIDKLEEDNKIITDVVIGSTKVKLDGEREKVRTKETNLGNLLTDALLDLTEADGVIINGGDIRKSIDIGEITREDILAMLPFGSYGVVLELKGIDILNALENGLSAYPDTFGGFPQVAGMNFKVDPSKEVGNRVYDLMIQGEPIDLNRTYKLATNDFLAAGGDRYESLKNGKLVGEYEALEEILIDYIQKIGEVNLETEGRIIFEEVKEDIEVLPEKEKPTIEEVYIVEPGDVLWKIAKKFNMNWQELSKYNKLRNPHLIFPGQKILVPVR